MRNLAQRMAERPSDPPDKVGAPSVGGARAGRLIAGPGVYICDGCVEFGNEIIEQGRSRGRI